MKCAIILVFVGVLVFALGETLQGGNENEVSPHIIGGDQVHPLTLPYTVKLFLSKGDKVVGMCGGARLDRYWFVTAAECLDRNKYNEIQFLYPADLTADTGRYNSRTYSFYLLQHFRYFVHPDYNNVTKTNNIGLFMCHDCTLAPEFYAKLTLPKISEKDATFAALTAIVSGWTIGNRTEEQVDEVMNSYKTNIVNSFWCKMAYFFIWVKNEHICASSWEGKRISKDAVGVPLVVEESGEKLHVYKLIGIATSIKPWSTNLPIPTVFTKIAPHLEWISKITEIDLRH